MSHASSRRSFRGRGAAAVLALFAALAACGGGSDAPSTSASSATTATGSGGAHGTGGSGGSGGISPDLPKAICHAGTKWKAGTKIFKESTSAWGLDALKVEGTRLDAVDFDGDGWPDLVVRRGGEAQDDFTPGGVRQTWLLRNTHDGHFEDVTEKSGLRKDRTLTDQTKGRPGEVVAFGDVNNDGTLDVFTGHTDNPQVVMPETSELLLNKGDGTFELGPASSPIRVKKPKHDAVAGASFVDFDRDGKLDLWVVENTYDGAPLQDRLYKGDGTGNFVDVTIARGLKTEDWGSASVADLNAAKGNSIGWSGTACDLDGDGNPELLAGSYGRAPNHLWRSKGPDGGFSFVNASVASGYAFDDGVDWRDNESARCWCKLHPSDQDCAGVPPPKYIACQTDADAFRWNHATDRELYRLGGNSASTECADLDNDGHLDLVTGEIAHWDVGSSSDKAELMHNTGGADLVFERPGNAVTGLARKHPPAGWDEGIMSHSVFDFDNDGWQDVYFGNSDYPCNVGLLYHQTSPGKFEPVSADDFFDHHRSHGSAVADFDRDGDLDIVVGHSLARCGGNYTCNGTNDCYATGQVRFFENVLGQDGNFVELTLTGGPATNRAAIGARVTVKAGDVTQTKEVSGGFGHYGSQNDLTLHFGLGDACEADVTIRWPDGSLTTQSFKLPSGYRFTVTQGEPPKAVPKP
jgi:hypothetical protein